MSAMAVSGSASSTKRSAFLSPSVRTPRVLPAPRPSLALRHPDHLSGVCDVVVFNDFANRVELPQVTVVGERVVLASGGSFKRDEHEDLIAAVEDCVRFEPSDCERRHGLEEPHDVRFAEACLQPRHIRYRYGCLPFDVIVQLV